MSLHDLIILNEKIEELEKQNDIMRSALKIVRAAEMMGLLINGKKLAEEALSQCEDL